VLLAVYAATAAAWKPKYMTNDMALAISNAGSQYFHNMTLAEYLQLTFRALAYGQRLLPGTPLRWDKGHYSHSGWRWTKPQRIPGDLKWFAYSFMQYMRDCCDMPSLVANTCAVLNLCGLESLPLDGEAALERSVIPAEYLAAYDWMTAGQRLQQQQAGLEPARVQHQQHSRGSSTPAGAQQHPSTQQQQQQQGQQQQLLPPALLDEMQQHVPSHLLQQLLDHLQQQHSSSSSTTSSSDNSSSSHMSTSISIPTQQRGSQSPAPCTTA
jgi:hypothetical protein